MSETVGISQSCAFYEEIRFSTIKIGKLGPFFFVRDTCNMEIIWKFCYFSDKGGIDRHKSGFGSNLLRLVTSSDRLIVLPNVVGSPIFDPTWNCWW